MEPNPISWLELRQLRRSPLPYLLFLVGVAMCVFLFWVGSDDTRPHLFWYTPMYWIPVVFHVLTLFGIPYTWAARFVSQQMSEDLVLQTPMDRSSVFLGKLKPGFLLVVLAYLPPLPGVAFWAAQNRWEYPIIFWLTFVASLCLVPVFLGFMAGVKTVAGVIGRIVLLFVYLFAGFLLFIILCGAGAMVLHELFGFTPNGAWPLIFAATGFMLCVSVLAAWTGCVAYGHTAGQIELVLFSVGSGITMFVVLTCIFGSDGHMPPPLLLIVMLTIFGFFGTIFLVAVTVDADAAPKSNFHEEQ